MYTLRSFAIVCAISALICLGFWIADAVAGTVSHFGWLLFSSILWAFVFEIAHRYLKRKGTSKTSA